MLLTTSTLGAERPTSGEAGGATDTSNRRSRLWRWLPAVGWALLIFALSSVPDLRVSPVVELELELRKVGHLVAFGVLAVLIAWAWTGPWRIAAGFVLALGYAALDEVHQAFVPGRTGDPADVAIDAAGAAVGLLAWHLWRRWTMR